MTTHEPADREDDRSVSRRDVLRTVGAAGALGTLGTETVAAQGPPPDRGRATEFIVGTTPGRADIAEQRAKSVKKVIDFDTVGQAVVGRWPEEALEGLKRNPHVRYIEENGSMQTGQQTLTYNIDRIDAEVAHANGDTGDGVDLAIIDTGIDTDHPDLPTIGTSHAFVDCSGSGCNATWDDDDSHGTHVAGIAAALDNTEDVVGVAPGVTLHAIKVCDGSGNCPFDAIADGIREAADQGYDVANLSLWGSYSSAVEDAVEYATDTSEGRNVVLVAINGNAGPCTDCVSNPAVEPEVIAVSSTDNQDNFSGFSSQGPETDIAAPGSSVLSTVPGGTGTKSGTSMAAPSVAGAAAQLIAAGTDPSDVRGVLKSTAEDIGLGSNQQGAGLLDVATALGHSSANDLLEVQTDAADDLDFTEATLNGDLIQATTGFETVTVGFEWGEQGSGLPNTIEASGSPLSATGAFEASLTGLEENTTYEFRAFAEVEDSPDDISTEYGTTETFSTVDNLDPNANFTWLPFEPNPDQTVTFDASSSNPGTGESAVDSITYAWDLDDDTAFDDATGVMPTWSYATGGEKTVRLEVTDEFDQTDVATETVYVNMAPTASFTVTTVPVVRNEPTTFDASGSMDPDGTVETYEWDWDYDGSTFVADESTSDETIDHTFTTGGEHTVALRVIDDDGATSDVVSETFTVYIRVEVDVHPNADGRNAINPNKKGNIPVAVLHTSAFDPPAELDPSTVRFGDPDDVGFGGSGTPLEGGTPQGGATPAHTGGHVNDVDDDGDMDSVFHFPTQDTGFESDDTEGELVGQTIAGVPVFGTDSVTIVGGGGP